MQVHELTQKEDRLGALEAIYAIRSGLMFDRCFYISHRKHGNDFLDEMERCLSSQYLPESLTSKDILVIDRSSEAGSQIDQRHAKLLRNLCQRTGLPVRNVVYISQASYLPGIRDAFSGGSLDDVPTWIEFHHFPYMMAGKYLNASDDFEFNLLSNICPKILCTNFKIRAHRRLLVEYLMSSGMVDDFILSYHANDVLELNADHRRVCERRFPRVDAYNLRHRGSEKLAENPVMKIDDDSNREDFILGFPRQAVRKSIFSLVCETDFDPASIRITEKAIKPMIYHRPFILWGAMGSLAILRDFGFRTFGEVIDESYDRIAYPEERFVRIVSETRRLLGELENKSFRQRFLEECRSTCSWNLEHVSSGGFKSILEESLKRSLNYLSARRPCFEN